MSTTTRPSTPGLWDESELPLLRKAKADRERELAQERNNEQNLDESIDSLWTAHLRAKNAARATKAELSDIRAKLGAQLSEMKEMLSKPGRGGQWSSWLQEKGIPRATADRLVKGHERSLNPDANRPNEATSEPTEEEVMRCFNSLWPKLRRTLRTRQSLLLFVEMLTDHFECGEADRVLVLTAVEPTICTASSDRNYDEPEFGAALVASAGEHTVECRRLFPSSDMSILRQQRSSLAGGGIALERAACRSGAL
jgi:hypothetical protein